MIEPADGYLSVGRRLLVGGGGEVRLAVLVVVAVAVIAWVLVSRRS